MTIFICTCLLNNRLSRKQFLSKTFKKYFLVHTLVNIELEWYILKFILIKSKCFYQRGYWMLLTFHPQDPLLREFISQNTSPIHYHLPLINRDFLNMTRGNVKFERDSFSSDFILFPRWRQLYCEPQHF